MRRGPAAGSGGKMRIVILGGGGFLGRKLAGLLAEKRELRGEAIRSLVLADLNAPAPVEAPFPVETVALDVTDAAGTAEVVAGADVIWHLAAIVSGQAEQDFDLGMKINLMGSLNVFEGARHRCKAPVVVFTSSIAVYGGEVPEEIEDWTALNPQGSYGAQKAAAELLLGDYSRKGFLDGRGVRVPTVTIRPGKPNAAASSFMSSIFREPMQGETSNCPVGRDFPIWNCSPRVAVANLFHAAEVKSDDIGQMRCFALPGQTTTVGEMIDAMTAVAGPEPATRITWDPDPFIAGVVGTWRYKVNPAKALGLGFIRDNGFEDNVRHFLEDDIQRPNG